MSVAVTVTLPVFSIFVQSNKASCRPVIYRIQRLTAASNVQFWDGRKSYWTGQLQQFCGVTSSTDMRSTGQSEDWGYRETVRSSLREILRGLDNRVSILRLGDLSSIPSRGRAFSVCLRVQTVSGVHPTSCLANTGLKEAGAWSWPPPSTAEFKTAWNYHTSSCMAVNWAGDLNGGLNGKLPRDFIWLTLPILDVRG